MKVEGEIIIKGPGLEDRKISTREPFELDVDTIIAKEPGQKFDIWVQIDEDEITVQTDIEDATARDLKMIDLLIKDQAGNRFSFALSIKQAKAIRDILNHYENAYYSIAVLCETRKVQKV